ncbi:MAG TPA: 2,3-diphosphoglycerate synthetase [Actinomycetota bacterium]|nr:2,3-diphosphoglycerate synthetase [Actinomycetota bacterium]
MTRALALVDGEHYPPTTRWALASARAEGYDVVACLFVGGTEKVPAEGLDLGDVTVERAGRDLHASVSEAIARHHPDLVLDLSDEPVLGYRERGIVAAAALTAGVRYAGPDFALEPPVAGPPLSVPTLAVIGTGKRTGKTAITGEAGRASARAGLDPVVVAMGRGGPPAPQVAEAGTVTRERLLELARAGGHAASDYLEDALTTGVTTIGARRAGGGLAGRPFVTNLREAAHLAERREPVPGLVILDGSGSAVPPLPWDAGVLVAPADIPVEYLTGYLGPYRLLLSDLVVITMMSGPRVGPQSEGQEDPSDLTSHVRRLHPGARIVVTTLRPVPLDDVEGKKVYLTTTAPSPAGPDLVSWLEEHHRCSVVGVSHQLADRPALLAELNAAPPYDVLLTELKAAAIDVAVEDALNRGAEVVFLDNRPETADGDGDVSELLLETARLAVERAGNR